MPSRKPIVIPREPQTWPMQTLGQDGVLLNVAVTVNWSEIQYLARRAHANKTKRTTSGPVSVKAVKP